jgi:hypothetical protein
MSLSPHASQVKRDLLDSNRIWRIEFAYDASRIPTGLLWLWPRLVIRRHANLAICAHGSLKVKLSLSSSLHYFGYRIPIDSVFPQILQCEHSLKMFAPPSSLGDDPCLVPHIQVKIKLLPSFGPSYSLYPHPI